MYPNLEAEMVRHNIKNDDIAKALGRDSRTIRSKRSGTTDFTLTETFLIKETFFPKLKLEYLFEQSDPISMADRE